MLALRPIVEVTDRHAQHLGQAPHARSRYAVGAAFVFLDLLEPHADDNGQLLLRQTEEPAARPQALAKVKIDILFHCVPP